MSAMRHPPRGQWYEPIVAASVTPTGAVAGQCVDIEGESWHRDGQSCRKCGFGRNEVKVCDLCGAHADHHCTKRGGALCGDVACHDSHGHSVEPPHGVPA